MMFHVKRRGQKKTVHADGLKNPGLVGRAEKGEEGHVLPLLMFHVRGYLTGMISAESLLLRNFNDPRGSG
jgi:hypothetical protein